MARSLARGLAAGGGKDPAHGPGGGELRDCPVDPRVDAGRPTLSSRLSLASRLANALVSYAAYVGQSFYPVNLAPFYPHLGTRLPIAWVAGSLVLLMAITAVATYCWRRRPYLLVGWLWFLGMLVPVIGLVGAFTHARADRYTYLSQIGLSIALAWGVWSVYRSRQSIQPGGAGGDGCSRSYRERRCSRLPPSHGDKLPTGAMPRRFGRIRSLAPSKI